MVVFESPFELSDVLGGVGKEYSVAVDVVVQPLAHVLHSVVVLQLVSLNAFELVSVLLRNGLVDIVLQTQTMVKRQVELLQPRSHPFGLVLSHLQLRLLGKILNRIGFFLRFSRVLLLFPFQSIMDSFLVDELRRRPIVLIGRFSEFLTGGGSLRDFEVFDVGLIAYIFKILIAVAHLVIKYIYFHSTQTCYSLQVSPYK